MKKTKGSSFRFYATLFLSFSSSLALYLPGVAPHVFHKGDPLYVKANKLTSAKTQLPYDYYYLNYCKPPKILNNAENLEEVVLRGDGIENNTVYTFKMLEDQPCKVSCRVKLDAESTKRFKEKIDDVYRANMILDGLPVTVLKQSIDGTQINVQGFRVGLKGSYAGIEEDLYFIYNHLSFRVIMYHGDQDSDSARIVGFEVAPRSITHEYKEWDDENNPQLTACNTENLIKSSNGPQEIEEGNEIVFTYDVSFI